MNINMINKSPIALQDLEKWTQLRGEAYLIENLVESRVTYIIQVMADALGYTHNTWYFEEANEGEVGDLFNNLNVSCREFPTVHLGWYKNNKSIKDFNIILKDGSWFEINCDGLFPMRWLFEEEFEKELIEGIKKAKMFRTEQDLKKKDSSKLAKQKNKVLVAQAKMKLSKEELNALKSEF